jgi:2-phosphoglycerate kinase
VTNRRYGDPLPLGDPGGLPYSKGMMARALIAAGVSAERSYALARRIDDDLKSRGESAVDLERLEELADEVIGGEGGAQTIRRLRRFAELQALETPIVVLLGGGTGTGKSTVATEVAHRLGITRVTSTDFIRQTIRAFFSEDFMPSVHYSSFEAGDSVADAETGDPTLLGFLDQTRNVLVGVEAAIHRALNEGWSMVLEGIHLVPGMVPVHIEGAIVVHALLRVCDEDVHRTHFHVRDASTAGVRAMDKYLVRINDIRRIQDYIVSRAERTGTPVIDFKNPDQATGELMELVLSSAERLQAVP